MSDTFLCQVDHVTWHPHALFAYGWAVHPRFRITEAHLVLVGPGGEPQRIRVSIDRPREDVAMAFLGNPRAANAGFLVLAGWSGDRPASAELVFRLTDGSTETTSLALPAANAPPQPAGTGWGYLLRRTWAHARLGRFRVLFRRIRQYRDRRRASAYGISAARLAKAIAGRPCALVVDHAMGGGANVYRDGLIDTLTVDGTVVLLLTFSVPAMRLIAELRSKDEPPRAAALDDVDAVAAMLDAGMLRSVFFNCAVSFPQPLAIRSLILSLTRRRKVALTVSIHDYFVVCPSPFLIDDAGKFCGIPDIARCRSCLPANDDCYVSLAAERSIDRWRSAWGEFLEAADVVQCFSESSRELLTRAYPTIGSRIDVLPHTVAPLRKAHVRRDTSRPLVVGVIGAISAHKGAEVVADLARAIVATGAPVRIVVLGSVDAACPPEVVLETGPYDRNDLPRLVEHHGVSMALLPSICPETFSFVAHEILSMGLPLMCFDLGAQAQIARKEPRGRVATRQDGPGLLEEVLAFDNDLHRSHPSPASQGSNKHSKQHSKKNNKQHNKRRR
jgi:glycosyltransferase involved in cell wall biosynthesis